MTNEEEEKRRVRLVLGDGPDAEVVGTADINVLPNGNYMIDMNLSDESVAREIGIYGSSFSGIIPSPNFDRWEENDDGCH
jgi:hypothetical protein